MEKKIDIISFLQRIVNENSRSYHSDFTYDKERLAAAMLKPEQENRTFLWMSRPGGTVCVLERDAFVQESVAHSRWTYYEHDAEYIKAYRVIVAPGKEGDVVSGKLQPLNYGEQVQRVKRNAIPADMINVYFESGLEARMLYVDYSQNLHVLADAYGKIVRTHRESDRDAELSSILQAERMISTMPKRAARKRKPPTR